MVILLLEVWLKANDSRSADCEGYGPCPGSESSLLENGERFGGDDTSGSSDEYSFFG